MRKTSARRNARHVLKIHKTNTTDVCAQLLTEWQEQGAREAAWQLSKSVLKLKEKNMATFFSPSENRCLPASTLKLEEREFVVDAGASMHVISKKGLE